MLHKRKDIKGHQVTVCRELAEGRGGYCQWVYMEWGAGMQGDKGEMQRIKEVRSVVNEKDYVSGSTICTFMHNI